MYRYNDIEKIDKNIDTIIDDAAKQYKTLYEPTLKEIGEVYSFIINYIKTNKRVVYGGFAQNLLVMQKNKSDAFYTEMNGACYNWPDIADIEFYSPTPIEDVFNLTDALYKKKYKFVEGTEGIHPETFKIFVNFLNYCDITYMPAHIYNNMPIIVVNGIKCTHPHFMIVDTYRILTDPMTSYWRIGKSIRRTQLLLKHYPIDQSNIKQVINFQEITGNRTKIQHEEYENILTFIRKQVVYDSHLIIVGLYAYNYYAKKVGDNFVLNNIPYYELITTDIQKDGKNIHALLVKKYGKKITVKEFVPFFTFMDRRIEFYHNNNLILILYGNNDRCIVHNYSEKKKIYFGTYNLVMMYLYFDYYYAFINRNKKNTNLFNNLISKFFNLRNVYLDNKKITVVDESPFMDFTYKCHGIPVDPIRASRLAGAEKKKQGKKIKFRHTPSEKTRAPLKQEFSNTSGNQNSNKKYLILKN
jgi:hypothetical protein